MAFLTPEEITNIYGYQIDQIKEDNSTAMLFAIDAAIDEVSTYLQDANEVFSKTGDERNALMKKLVQTIAKWNFVEVCNVDIIYQQAQERYDRAIAILENIKENPSTLISPQTGSTQQDETPSEEEAEKNGGLAGSNTKFKHL